MTRFGTLRPLRRIEGSTVELSDDALVAACATGDSAALGALIDRFQAPMYRFVARLLGSDRTERDDLVQQTFVEVARSAARFRQRSTVRVWIFGIAANLTRNHIRTMVRQRGLETRLAAVPPLASSRPDEELARHQLVDKLRLALAALPHPLREALVLCEVEDMTAAEAAKILGTRQGTVWRRVHEARRELQAALAREDG